MAQTQQSKVVGDQMIKGYVRLIPDDEDSYNSQCANYSSSHNNGEQSGEIYNFIIFQTL